MENSTISVVMRGNLASSTRRKSGRLGMQVVIAGRNDDTLVRHAREPGIRVKDFVWLAGIREVARVNKHVAVRHEAYSLVRVV